MRAPLDLVTSATDHPPHDSPHLSPSPRPGAARRSTGAGADARLAPAPARDAPAIADSVGPLGALARKGFLPVDDRAQFEVIVRLPEGRSVAATELVGQRVARLIRSYPEVEATLVAGGIGQTPFLAYARELLGTRGFGGAPARRRTEKPGHHQRMMSEDPSSRPTTEPDIRNPDPGKGGPHQHALGNTDPPEPDQPGNQEPQHRSEVPTKQDSLLLSV